MGIPSYVVDDWCRRSLRQGFFVGLIVGFLAGLAVGVIAVSPAHAHDEAPGATPEPPKTYSLMLYTPQWAIHMVRFFHNKAECEAVGKEATGHACGDDHNSPWHYNNGRFYCRCFNMPVQ
jgi:hypothetical protein